MRALFAFLLLAMNVQAKDIYVDSKNPTSHRCAILEDDGRTAFLYLTATNTVRPERDIVVYCRDQPAAKVDWKEVERTGKPPPLTQDDASEKAVIKSPQKADFALVWSGDGESVLVLYRKTPWAMIVGGQTKGYSKALKRDGAFGLPWDQKAYEQAFRPPKG
jgi:hypothetical protein